MKATVEKLLKVRIANGGFDRNFEKMTVVSAQEGRVVAGLTVAPEHCNVGGVLHGGLVASLADCVSTLALLSLSPSPGVSTDLSVSFLRPAPAGTSVLVTAKTLRRGTSLAFLSIRVSERDSGRLLATASHTKFLKQ